MATENSPWLEKLGEGNDMKLTRLRRAVQRRREAGGGETNRWRLPLTDKELGPKRNIEECGKGLWGRRWWCATRFVGPQW
jgi:hypothetical protein